MTKPHDTLASIPELAPLDEHNQQLGHNVHPPGWVSPQPAARYNMVVIGAGTAGLVTAAGTAGLGGKVALIERNLMGGDCLNVGCVPSKALIRAARAAADVRDAGNFGVRVPEGVTVDFAAVMERMRRLRAGISKHDSAQRFKDLGVDVFIGDAQFTGRNEVTVEGKKLVFSKACIATGARAAELPIPGLHEAGVLTNESVFSLTQLPARLAVIGAGPIGVELAQTFARLGSRVTLLEQAPQILGREDREAAGIVQRSLQRDGVEIECGVKITSVRRRGEVRLLTVEREGGVSEHEFDQVLAGVGRQPNIETLNLNAAGVAFDPHKGVQVDDRLRTTNSDIFAAGDVCSAYKFTHAADAMARVVIQNALFFGRAAASALNIPWCTYSDPEIAHVGLYEQDARERGIELDTFRIDMVQVDRAVLEGETEGFLKIHVKKGTDRILGATMVSRHAGEHISQITLAMNAGAGLSTIAKTIHPYPTQAEAIKKAADAHSRTRLTPTVKVLFDKLLAWRR